MSSLVLVSGGFDPVHSGHINLIKEASIYGEVVVLLNSDEWLRKKKGNEFLPYFEREIIMQSIKNVKAVLSFDDKDMTCIDGLKKAILKYPNYNIKFANGGDRNETTVPNQETIFCNENNIEILWGIGGNFKANSSSQILKRWNKLS